MQTTETTPFLHFIGASILALICGLLILLICHVTMLLSADVTIVLGLCYGSLLVAHFFSAWVLAAYMQKKYRTTQLDRTRSETVSHAEHNSINPTTVSTNTATSQHKASSTYKPKHGARHKAMCMPLWGVALVLIVVWQWFLNPMPIGPAIAFQQYYALIPGAIICILGLCIYWIILRRAIKHIHANVV